MDSFAVAPDAETLIDNAPGTIEAIPAGARLTVRLSIDEKQAVRIEARGAMLTATITAIDPAQRTLTLSFGKESRTEKILSISSHAKLAIDGKPAGVEDIPTGARANITMSADGKMAMEITIGRPAPEGRER